MSVQYKVLFVTIITGILVFSVLTWDLEVSLRRVEREAISASAGIIAQAVALACSAALAERDLTALVNELNRIVDGKKVVNASVADETGRVLARSEKRFVLGLPRVGVSAPVLAAGRQVGTVYLGLQLRGAPAGLGFARRWAWVAVGFILVTSAAAVRLLMRRLLRSLALLEQSMRKIVTGECGVKLEDNAEEEVQAVARELDALARSMHIAQKETQQRNRELVRKVDERGQELHFRKEELWMRGEVLRSIADHAPLEGILELVVNNAARLLDASNCFLFLLEKDSQELVGVARSEGRREEFKRLRVHMDADLDIVRAVKGRRPYLVWDTRNSKEANRSLWGWGEGKAAMFLPLITHEEVIGAMVLEDTRAPRYYTGEDVERASAISNEAAIAIGYATLVRELTEAQETLKRSEQKYRRLVENANDAIFMLDAAGKVTSANKQLYTMLGADHISGELLGSPLGALVAPEERERLGALIAEILQRGSVSDHRVVFLARGGKKVLGEGNFVATHLGNGAIIQGVVRDVTERQALERRLVQSEKLAALGRLSAGIAHEIRNPLNAINIAAYYVSEALDDEEFNPAELQEHLYLIKRNVRRVQGIISDVLKFARPSGSGKVPVDLNALTAEAVELVEGECRAQSIKVVTNFQPLPKVLCARDTIQQALLNIIENAIQAMPEGGVLSLRTRNSLDKRVAIEVTDSGCGIPVEHIQSIFDPFFTTKEPGKGTGLGLSIARSAVEANGGQISVESVGRMGSSFTISFEGIEGG